MTMWRLAISTLAVLLVGCSNHHGLFEPACLAVEGETIELRSDGFSWQRFTDEYRVDDDGEVIDPFPGFPKSGSYTLKKGRVYLHADDGTEAVERYLYKHSGDLYLLTLEHHNAVVGGAGMPDCALRRNDEDS